MSSLQPLGALMQMYRLSPAGKLQSESGTPAGISQVLSRGEH